MSQIGELGQHGVNVDYLVVYQQEAVPGCVLEKGACPPGVTKRWRNAVPPVQVLCSYKIWLPILLVSWRLAVSVFTFFSQDEAVYLK